MSADVQEMRIFGILEQIEEAVEDSPKPKIGGGNRRVVDADEIYDLLGDLKVTIPEDIRRANSVIAETRNITDNADEYARETVQKAEAEAARIVSEAQANAEQISVQAKAEYERLISQDEVYQEAQRRAQLLAAKAEYNANCVYENAKVYADEVLVDIERFIAEYDQLIKANRRDLGARAQQPVQQAQYQQPAAQQAQYQQPAQPIQYQQQPEEQQAQPAQPKQQRHERKAVVEDIYDDEDDFDDDDDDDRGSFLGLFKRKKKAVDDDDFMDDSF